MNRKIIKKATLLLFSLCLTLLQTCPALAADGEYTYTVRLFSGAQGTINGKEMIVKEGLRYGDRVTFNQKQVTLGDESKYYIKGIRESGKDNNTVNDTSSFPVTGDMDYVVVYGLLADAVSYTINYLDAAGNRLAPSETYYGNVGDSPVIAYLYIEGYQPQAYNLTGTLKANAADNVFNFVYTAIASPGANQPTTAPSPGATVAPPAAPGATGTAGTGAPANPANAAEGETDENEGGEGAEEGGEDAGGENEDAEAGNAEPQELERIDDDEAPLANTNLGLGEAAVNAKDFAKRIGDFPLAAKIGICAAVLLAVGAAAWLLLIRKKRGAVNE